MTSVDEIQALLEQPETPVIKTYDKPGKGRKQCSHCKVLVGVRTKVCVCGETFEKRPQVSNALEMVEQYIDPERQPALLFAAYFGVYPRKGSSIVYAPRGDCPVKFRGDVEQWCSDVLHFAVSRDEAIISPSGLRLWLREFHKGWTPEYKEYAAEINRLVKGVVDEQTETF